MCRLMEKAEPEMIIGIVSGGELDDRFGNYMA